MIISRSIHAAANGIISFFKTEKYPTKGFPVGSVVKTLPAKVQAWGREDPLKKKMATHSSILAWNIPWTEEPSRLQSMGLQRVRH